MTTVIDHQEAGVPRRRRTLAIALFIGVCALLIGAYYLFLRTDYTMLYTGLKPADAAAIVAQLDAKGVAHRLRDNGTTILVPAEQADNLRLAVAGSDLAMKGAVGFELFNKSDMGLTDFAQKINYQRALQGELARSIMMMDGIETARVHLALPERSLFRADRAPAKAAVEAVARLGRPLSPAQVDGIQQLVAAAVPELALSAVVVIDGDGRVVSRVAVSAGQPSAENQEQAAAQAYYAARAKAALASAMPGLAADVRALIIARSEGADAVPAAAPSPAPAPSQAAVPGDIPAKAAATPASVTPPKPAQGNTARNFALRVIVVTPTALAGDDQAAARRAVAGAVALDESVGDTLSFETGPIAPAAAPPPIAVAGPDSDNAAAPSWSGATLNAGGDEVPARGGGWIWIVAVLLTGAGGAWWLTRRRVHSQDEQAAFVARLRARLGHDDAATNDAGRAGTRWGAGDAIA